MPDYTMCKGTGCMLRETCKRFTATPHEMQSWFLEVPWDAEELDCDEFMPNEAARKEEIW